MREAAVQISGAVRISGEAQPREHANPLLPLCVRGLSYEAGGRRLIEGLDLTLGGRGITMIMGHNGAGKSLLLRLLHGLIAPAEGEIVWNGAGVGASTTARQALVFQKPVLLRRSVRANIDFVLRSRGLPRDRCDALLARVGLSARADQAARLLSGGEAQRLALARALATGPEVLFLDEPTASLDPSSVLAIEEIVRETAATGVRVVFVTHDIAQARRLADEVAFMCSGRLVEHRPASAFFAAPQSEEARAYLAGRLPPG